MATVTITSFDPGELSPPAGSWVDLSGFREVTFGPSSLLGTHGGYLLPGDFPPELVAAATSLLNDADAPHVVEAK